MKSTIIAIAALAGTAGMANAQAFFEVFVNGAATTEVDLNNAGEEIVDVSVYLDRNGDTREFFSSFTAWSQFGGSLTHEAVSATGWETPDEETVGDRGGANADLWEGRRPPAFPVPGGSAGGFRFAAANYTNDGAELGNIAGIAASSALGGFQHDTSERIEIFRATLDLTGANAAAYNVTWVNGLTQIFIDAGFNIERSVFEEMSSNEARITVVPTPATASLLGLGGLAAMRRRR